MTPEALSNELELNFHCTIINNSDDVGGAIIGGQQRLVVLRLTVGV